MSITLKITQVGDSLCVVLPRELLAKWHVAKGDALHATEMSSGIALTPFEPDVAEQVALGDEFMREYREAFQELAK